MTRLLASKPDHQVLGQTEFQVRDIVHQIGAKAVQAELDARQKKLPRVEPDLPRVPRRRLVPRAPGEDLHHVARGRPRDGPSLLPLRALPLGALPRRPRVGPGRPPAQRRGRPGGYPGWDADQFCRGGHHDPAQDDRHPPRREHRRAGHRSGREATRRTLGRGPHAGHGAGLGLEPRRRRPTGGVRQRRCHRGGPARPRRRQGRGQDGHRRHGVQPRATRGRSSRPATSPG